MIIIYYYTIHLGLSRTQEENENGFPRFPEQDAERNRERTLEETARYCTPQSTSIPLGSRLEGNLEELLQEKADLERNLRCLDEQERELDQRARILCEKITQEIRKRNNEKQRAIYQLQDANAKMENQLGFENSIQEAKRNNIEKQEDISRLREKISALETEFGDLTKPAHTPVPVPDDPKKQEPPASPKRDADETDATTLDIFPV